MRAIPTTRLIAGREIRERLQSRLIWVMTAITTLSVVALIAIPGLVDTSGRTTVVGLVGSPAQALGTALRAAAGAVHANVEVVDLEDRHDARMRLRDGDLDVTLSLGEDTAVAEVKETLAPEVAALLRAVVDDARRRQVLGDAGVPEATVTDALSPVPLSTVTLEPPSPDRAARSVAALAAGLLLYVTLGLYAAAVAGGVAQEKTSRTAEVLLATVRPAHLLNGKVLGIGACGVAQMGIAVGAGLVANAVVQRAEIPSTVWALLPTTLLWFILGFALYAFGYAAAGAMVARQEEVQFVTAPITLPLVGAFLLMYAAMAAPETWWIRVLSYLPPFAPVLMPARLALGHLAAWEMPVAVLVAVTAVYAVARLAARIYVGAIMRGGARLTWGEALRLPRP